MLGPGGTFVDVGANLGWFSLLGASLVGPLGRVIAVEPNPINVALLRDSAKDNGFDNIDTLVLALAAKPGAIALETDGSNGRITPIDGPPAEPIEASFVVAARPFDDVLSAAAVTRVDAIKIDVEGAEPLVLKGAGDTITAAPTGADQRVLPARARQLAVGKCATVTLQCCVLSATAFRSSAPRATRTTRPSAPWPTGPST